MLTQNDDSVTSDMSDPSDIDGIGSIGGIGVTKAMLAKNVLPITAVQDTHTSFPSAPRTIEQTGLPFLFLVELLAKVLFLRGQMRLIDLSHHLKLAVSLLDPLITFMRAEKLCEITCCNGNSSGTDADLSYKLTELGRARAAEFLNHNAYSGPAPVTLAAYCAQVEAQSVANLHIVREHMEKVFNNIVVNPIVLEQLGAAMNSRRAIFIHGPAGSGKTYLAERLAGLLQGHVFMPYAIAIDSEVVQMYDPMVHHTLLHDTAKHGFDKRMLLDARWLECARPAILTGGELTLSMLDLQFDQGTRFYQAPPHLKANNGIFIIDDLSRQHCSPMELMNRWIIPMDRHIDYLSLHTGHKFCVPFDVIVVFSSNLPPEQLADSAFLRRLGYKIYIGPLAEAQYECIFRQTCQQYGVSYSADAFQYLLHTHHYKKMRPLLACYPRDILAQIRDLAMYQGTTPSLNEKVLDWAWNNYFSGS